MDTHDNVKQFALHIYAKHVAQELSEVCGTLKAARTAILMAQGPKYEQGMADTINALCGLEGKDRIEPTDLDDIEDNIFNGYRATTELLEKICAAIGTINDTISQL